MKRCGRCGIEKALDEFHRDSKGRMGRARYCKPCACKKASDWVKDNPERAKAARLRWAQANREKVNAAQRERHRRDPARATAVKRKHLYGVDADRYSEMMAAQSGCCAICREATEKLHVDHDHETGAVRGLLCRMCNQGLGFLRDNAEVMRNAIDYLERSWSR